jgi:multidrug efflux pump
VLKLMGFGLNNLTLFGLVLAIGIVVDDSIVVLENIERWLDKGLAVREATIKAMSEITGPIMAITLVLSSVFLPSAFLGGITGEFFRQFALTISAAMILSAVNAMTMTPARAASIFASRKPGQRGNQGKEAFPWWGFGLAGGLLAVWVLKPILGAHLGLVQNGGEDGGKTQSGFLSSVKYYAALAALFIPGLIAGGVLGWFIIDPVNWLFAKIFGGFNWVFDRTTQLYGKTVAWFLRLSVIVLVVYLGLLAVTGYGLTRVPGGFIPSQDKGRLIINIQLPDSASLERTNDVVRRIEKIALETKGVDHTLGNPGRSFVFNSIGSNLGSMFVTLKPFEERRAADLYVDAIAARLRQRFREEIPGAVVNVFGAPAVDGLGNAGGFKLMVEAIGDVSFDRLQGQADNLVIRRHRSREM